MAIVKPFKAVRPSRDKVALVSSKSFDAYTDKELDAKLEFNPCLLYTSPSPRD